MRMKITSDYLIQRCVCALAVLLLSATDIFAQQADNDGLATDITVSLLDVAPGYTIYTAHGHCALRLQCPSAGLDLSFTYGLDDTVENRISFFTGKGMGEYSAARTESYLKDYVGEGRQVKEYELNLSIDQKRHLWKLLDDELSRGAFRPYNYLKTNCSTMCAHAVVRALSGDVDIVYESTAPVLNGTYRDLVRHVSSHRPWVDFFWNTLLGAEGEETGQIEDKLSPSLLVETWQHTTIVDSLGTSRPMLVDNNGRVVVEGDDGQRTTWFTPTVCFALLLLLVVLLSIAEYRGHLLRLAHGVDVVLFVLQTIIGFIICYITFFSSHVGAAGNWYAIPCNPVPFVCWLLFRHRKGYRRLFLVYFVVLCLFMVLTPFVPQLDLPHCLVVAILAVRCLANGVKKMKDEK